MTDQKVTDLTPATTPLTGAETIYAVQGGLDVQLTAQDVADLAGGGSATISTAIVDFGAFSYAVKTSVASPTITGSSKVMATLAAPTEPRDADELEFSPICIGVVVNAGVGFDIYATAPIGADGQFNVNYTIGA